MITIRDLSLSFGQKVIFNAVNGQIEARDRIGLVGSNGSGKSTLLKLLAGLEEPDAGSIERAGYVTIGYLPQDAVVSGDRTLQDEMESAFPGILAIRSNIERAQADLDAIDPSHPSWSETVTLVAEWEHRLHELEAHKLGAKIGTVLHGLGFSSDDSARPCRAFSGGWQMRIALAKLLLQEPSLLLLDEPTNHLDLDSLRWLESWLMDYDGAILLVSHDRAFLDALSRRTFALHLGQLELYAGNYTFFLSESTARREQQAHAFRNQQREIARTERFIERFRYQANKASQVQSRIKSLARVERIEVEEEEGGIQFRFPPPPRSGHSVISIQGLRKSYGDLTVLRDLDLEITRGERVAIVGVNGAGKSTLIRIMAGSETFQEGQCEVGHNVTRAYFAQHQAEALDPDRSVLDTACEGQPMEVRLKVRSLLGAFLFSGDDVFKPVGVLSGGEKNRLALCRMLLQPANFLILDEPTNHLDMRSKGVLQEALLHYTGTFVVVSHDRAFLDPLVTRVIEVSRSGVRSFPGNVSEYIQRTEDGRPTAVRPNQESGKAPQDPPSSPSSRQRRRQEADLRNRLAPLRKRFRALEQSIADREAAIKSTEAAMMDPAFFQRGANTTEDVRAYEALKDQLAQEYAEWENLALQLEGQP